MKSHLERVFTATVGSDYVKEVPRIDVLKRAAMMVVNKLEEHELRSLFNPTILDPSQLEELIAAEPHKEAEIRHKLGYLHDTRSAEIRVKVQIPILPEDAPTYEQLTQEVARLQHLLTVSKNG